MRYEATVRYEGKSVTFKVTNQILQGRFELKDFLKSVRESRNHCIQTVHLMTDFGSDECEDYETGRKRRGKGILRKRAGKSLENGFGPEDRYAGLR